MFICDIIKWNVFIRGAELIILGIDPGFAIVGWGILSYVNNKQKFSCFTFV